MFNFINKAKQTEGDFDYLEEKTYYFDSACQTLRPESVIKAQENYYHKFNSCGHRVKYKWGEKTDALVEECRENLLKLVGKSSKYYTVAFGLNTTEGINKVLQQLAANDFEKVITSEIEHNSVFLPTITWAKRNNRQRDVLPRVNGGLTHGNLIYDREQLKKSIVIVNTMSNIDGQELGNLTELTKDVHDKDGIILLDACQTLGHHPELLKNVDFDACFGSGHKMYGPSVGFTIIKKSLLEKLDYFWIGGSTVQDVHLDSFELVDDSNEIYSRIEPGLQNYAGIIGLGEALEWKSNWHPEKSDTEKLGLKGNAKAAEYESALAEYLQQKLTKLENIILLNSSSSSVVSLYSPNIDSHKFAIFLNQEEIMCRTGYHCCHYYLKTKLNLPPLLRLSLGLQNTPDQVDFTIKKMQQVLETFK